MNLNHIRIFVRVAEAGSFSEAARRLQLPKSQVSRQVRLLEEALGARLFERTTRLALISGFFAPLALVVLAPIIVNILYFHLSLDPVGIPVGIMLAVLAMVVAHGYRNVFLPLLQPRMKRNEDASVGVSAV
tara:strand:- start:171 stop:563 length:393 start_codon:yes stop_codon:yes gene_type:complete